MRQYIIRLDDACERRDIEKWNRMEILLNRYGVKPLVGVIPDCQDPKMMHYDFDDAFWERVHAWEKKGWTIAMHGYRHLYHTKNGGINPVNLKSEFAGRSYEEQCSDIAAAYFVLQSHGIRPKVFFAPSHTYDRNTIKALLQKTDIRIISDTVAKKPYTAYGMTFVPQQAPGVADMPYDLVTFAYHPNHMKEADFERLDAFLQTYASFTAFPLHLSDRKKSLADRYLSAKYMTRIKLKRLKRKLLRQ